MQKLLGIIGPTAVGKSAVAIELACGHPAEIVSCDSMQVYRGLDIGTAKTGERERREVPHHLLDIVDPEGDFTVADYQIKARAAIMEIQQRGKLPILVGGSGLYYQAVVDHYDFVPLPGQPILRQQLEQRANQAGISSLYQELQQIDPDYALKIGPNDRKRIIRGLEVYLLTGTPFSQTQRKRESGYDLLIIGLTLEREELYRRIETRVDLMLEQGLVNEVAALKQSGYDLSCKSMNSLGYRQVQMYLNGALSYDQMVTDIKKESRRFAKRQITWFKRDHRIQWIDCGLYDQPQVIVKKIEYLMAQKQYFV